MKSLYHLGLVLIVMMTFSCLSRETKTVILAPLIVSDLIIVPDSLSGLYDDIILSDEQRHNLIYAELLNQSQDSMGILYTLSDSFLNSSYVIYYFSPGDSSPADIAYNVYNPDWYVYLQPDDSKRFRIGGHIEPHLLLDSINFDVTFIYKSEKITHRLLSIRD